MSKSQGSAVWNGDLKTGTGMMNTESGALSNARYGFNSRFTGGEGSNPEEVIGAAHAGCFSMALSLELGERGVTADSIHTTSTVFLDEVDGGFAVTRSHLNVTVKAPGADKAKMQEATESAKVNCPISKLLKADITMDATYEV
ncbi:osmotically inducible protein OsmC [Parvularcula bermudensis HTCC2503]|uniref:Osmotically inducible protein OsmC n=1 Tax=Parvularcula bermudensis (strain ATCC BAA-594 / HTCC2503 / KCTC 12087) TaxID=314260 RepID=E0TFP6_PARBH|nr:OsmC family protein [Parvularcula bermudensis]ADM09061.1 osmotically inducible protein OsmC [Parvularcula bermudensis HTCC2503]